MQCNTSSCPFLSVAQTQYDPLRLLYSRRKRFEVPKLTLNSPLLASQLRSSWIFRASSFDPNGVHTEATALLLPGGRAFQQIGPAYTVHVHMCSFRVRNEWGNHPRALGVCRDSAYSEGAFGRNSLGQLGSMRRMCVHTRAFNPQNGGGGNGGRTIINLAGAGLLTYLTLTGRLNWLFDTIFTLWLVSAVLWWFAERSLIKGPCPNCGGEFQVFEFSLKEEHRLCPYCSQPFKLEDKKFVRDEPQFSNQQTRGFKQPFGGFGGFEDFGRPTSSRKKEDSSGVIVDIEAEVRDKD